MDRFGFFKENLRTKGPSIAKNENLEALLRQEEDKKVDQGTFEAGLKAATDSKHATDKILEMMKLRSIASKKDNKKIIYITLPLSPKDEGKIRSIASSFESDSSNPKAISENIDKLINSYNHLGRLAKVKISWVIAKMHNREQLAKLAHDTKDRKKEVRAMLKFIQDNPITSYIQVKSSKDADKPRIYTLNAVYFKDVLERYKISISEDFSNALDKYTGPEKGVFKRGLPAHGNEKIKAYNEALKKLMEEGTIGGKYPDLTEKDKIELGKQRWNSFSAEIIKSRPTTFQELKEKVNRHLTTEFFDKLKTFFQSLEKVFNEQDNTQKEKQIKDLTEQIPSDIPGVPKYVIGDILYKIFHSTTTQTTTTTTTQTTTTADSQSFDAFSHSQTEDPFAELGSNNIKAQWSQFCYSVIYNTFPSAKDLDETVKRYLAGSAFKGLKEAFELLGKAFGKTGKDKEKQINAAKEKIPGDIPGVSKDNIEKIFDAIVPLSSEPPSFEQQWDQFCSIISAMPKTTGGLALVVKRYLADSAFKGLKDAFELLGEALDGKTGKEKADKLKAAKEAITGDIEVGSEKIAKSEIKKIFDEIVKILTPEKQWEEFCRYVSNINKSDTLKASIDHFLIDEAFEALKGAFDLLGKALDEKGEEKKTKLGDAKAAITGDIKAGSKTIKKSEIEEIFDKIVKIPTSKKSGFAASGTGRGLAVEIKHKPQSPVSPATPEATPTATSTATLEAIKLSESNAGSADNAQANDE